ncbi:major facilitator superfamily domain-containing protein 6-A-like isoform X2 [Lineus longissimus]|uniref:major facilitator superfamily domain-containing protein 6-A-like isoform X2 n=1 Tax=Lineus longissimus TaxID=88925 RepID=UPI00315CEAD7
MEAPPRFPQKPAPGPVSPKLDVPKAPMLESLPKKTKTRDCFDQLFTYVNYDLFIAKAFYFFFFSAFGSLFPLMAVYFKQLGMNATQSGFLLGFRPFVEFCSAPFWGSIADKFKKAKLLLLFSLFCWVVFTLALAFIQPPAHSCIVLHNSTHMLLEAPRFKRSITMPDSFPDNGGNSPWEEVHEVIVDNLSEEDLRRLKRDIKKRPPKGGIGQSPYIIEDDYVANKKAGETEGLVSPPFSNIVYERKSVTEVFFLLLLLIVIGEFFSAPAITLADAAVLGYLGDDVENYGKQRLFGSLGWGLSMFFVGVALDHSTTFPDHPCPTQEVGEKNYTICFAVFVVLMCFAWLAATQFNFMYELNAGETIPLSDITRRIKERLLGLPGMPRKKFQNPEDEDELFDQSYKKVNGEPVGTSPVPLTGPKPIQQDSITIDANDRLQISLSENDRNMVADAVQNKPAPPSPAKETKQNWITVLKLFGTVRYVSFLYVTWFMGFGIGLIFTFLFWHLQDLGGSPTLFGIASVINHISEIVAYFFSNRLIGYIGHVKVLYLGLAGNVARFLYISWLKNPWWVLPFEFVQGLTHAAVWAACCSYITQAIPNHLRSSAQGVLQGIHHGLGRGCGAILGGVFVYYFGSELTFRGYGFASLIILALFVGVNYFIKETSQEAVDIHEPKEYLEETSHLAPCGVPMNPMSRNLSSSKLSEYANEAPQYGSTDAKGLLSPTGGADPSFRPQGQHKVAELPPTKMDSYGYDQPASTKPVAPMQAAVRSEQRGPVASQRSVDKPSRPPPPRQESLQQRGYVRSDTGTGSYQGYGRQGSHDSQGSRRDSYEPPQEVGYEQEDFKKVDSYGAARGKGHRGSRQQPSYGQREQDPYTQAARTDQGQGQQDQGYRRQDSYGRRDVPKTRPRRDSSGRDQDGYGDY